MDAFPDRLHRGPGPIADLGEADAGRLLVAVRAFSERPDVAAYWTSADRFQRVANAWITMIGQLRLVLYRRGQIREPPRKVRPCYSVRATQPAMGALVQRWLDRRALGLRPSTVYHLALTARSFFLAHLATSAPEVESFAAVNREHVLAWMTAMSTDVSPKTGRPLVPQTQRSRLVRLAQFFKDADDWGWREVPRWPLVAHRDLPLRSDRLPRFIPEAELAQLMNAIRGLSCPLQRALRLLAR